MKAYKIFRILKDSCTSALVDGDAGVHYYPNIPATAPGWLAEKGYHLTVFDNAEHAIRFLGDSLDPDLDIEEVEVGEEVPLPPMANPFLLSAGIIATQDEHGKYPEEINKEIEAKFQGSVELEHSAWPQGTRMVRWVKRTEQRR